MASVVKKVEALGFPFKTLDPFLCPRRPGAVKRPSHFPMYIGFVWRFCMGAQGAYQPKTAVSGPGSAASARTSRTCRSQGVLSFVTDICCTY